MGSVVENWPIEHVFSDPAEVLQLDDQLSAELIDYIGAFFRISRPMVRFFWKSTRNWLDVVLIRHSSVATQRQAPHRVSVQISEATIPRGVTQRELEVLTLVALGLTNSEISARLGTSTRTVSTQLERLLSKLDQKTRGGLAALATDSGMLRLPLPGGTPDQPSIGVAELELAYRHELRPDHAQIRDFTPHRLPIRLGMILPKDLSSDTEQMLNGAELAIQEINSTGGISGRMLEVHTAAVSHFDWHSVNTGLETLFDARVDAIITNYVSAEHPDFLDIVADYGRPFLHTATFEADVQRAEASPFRYGSIFQTCASETHYAPGMLRFLTELEKRGLWLPQKKRIVCIEQESESMRLLTPSFRHEAQEAGWTIAPTIGLSTQIVDWDAVIEQVRDTDPDVLLLANYLEHDQVAFQEAFQPAGIPALVYGVYAPSIPSFVGSLEQKADGVLWATTTGTYDDEIGQRFRHQYRRRFGTEPGWSQAGAAYDQVMMLSSAWASVEARNVDEVVRSLRRWPFRGVNGVYFFGETRHEPLLYPDTTSDAAMGQAHFVYQIQNGGHRLLAPEPFADIESFRLPEWCR